MKARTDTLIGIDLGTSAIKGVLVSTGGRILARERRATELLRPAPGHVEFSSQRCYAKLCEILRALTASAPPGARVAALALSGATGNTLIMDRDGAPLGNAISWMDSRSADDPDCDPPGISAKEGHRIVGWPIVRGFPLAHLSWLKKNRSEAYRNAGMMAMNITYLYHRLTGKWGMDHSAASTFYLQDQVNHVWHKPFLEWLDISEDRLPPLMPSGRTLGAVHGTAASETGLVPGTAAVLGSFDHPSAARACGILEPGDVLLSCGTSWVGFYPVLDRDLALSQNMLVDPFLSPRGPWGAIFSLPKIGDEVQAFVERTFTGEPTLAARFAAFNEAAARSAPGSSEPCRAIMERISRDMKRKMDDLSRKGLAAKRIFMVGGPSESRVWPGIVSDITGLEISLPEIGSYAGALGAAILAGMGAGIFKDESEAAARFNAT